MKTILVGVERAAIFATSAIAEPRDKRWDVRVSIADLDLATPDGVAVFDRRLAKAVLKACGPAFHLDSGTAGRC